MILIAFIQILAGITGGIPTVVRSPECLLISRILVGLHSGEYSACTTLMDVVLYCINDRAPYRTLKVQKTACS